MSDVLKKFPWWGWVLLAVVAVLIVLLSVPGLRDHAVKMLGGVFALVFGVKAAQRTAANGSRRREVADVKAEVDARTDERQDRADDASATLTRLEDEGAAREQAPTVKGLTPAQQAEADRLAAKWS